MSARSKIVKALIDKLGTINGVSPFNTQVFSQNISNRLKFWDEVNDYPFISVVAGTETREYLPAGFKWGWFNVALKVYVYGEDCQDLLENVIEDIEYIVTHNERLEYSPGKFTTEVQISSITTDEGVLTPYGVGEVNLIIRYQVM